MVRVNSNRYYWKSDRIPLKDKEAEARWLISNGLTKPELAWYFGVTYNHMCNMLRVWNLVPKTARRGWPKGVPQGPRIPKLDKVEQQWNRLLQGGK
ncbi:MAG: hypothetical protein C5B59_17470 [Bacteroidetes bacterium]|nr:MAG: hypothetical protein C5B59_17470 [Bacteroidota bacterium]